MQSANTFTEQTVRWLDTALIVVASVGLLAMMVHISLDVIADLVLNAPLPLTSVYVTEYYMICVAFLPLFITEYRNGHISVDMFVKFLPDGLRRALGWLVQAVFIVVYVILAAQSWQQFTAKLAVNAYVMEQTSRVIVWPSFLMLPVAFGLAALLMVAKLVLDMLGRPVPAAPSHALDGVQDKEAAHV